MGPGGQQTAQAQCLSIPPQDPDVSTTQDSLQPTARLAVLLHRRTPPPPGKPRDGRCCPKPGPLIQELMLNGTCWNGSPPPPRVKPPAGTGSVDSPSNPPTVRWMMPYSRDWDPRAPEDRLTIDSANVSSVNNARSPGIRLIILLTAWGAPCSSVRECTSGV